MFKIKIAHSSAEVERIIDLRVKILRKPWNQPAETATDAMEILSVNVYIENEKKEVVACGRLQENENKVGQIRFMAVDDSQQGKGLGKLIVKALEEEGKKLNLKTIELQARENAIEFYKSCGYAIKEKTFLLWGIIQHYLMEKKL
jgi:N-acetylglutamate synthase-like GNAT family acetyltransferase